MSQNDKYWNLIILVSTQEATFEEEEELRRWIELSDENRIFFEKSRKIIESTFKSGPVPVFDTDRAWEKVSYDISRGAYNNKLRIRKISRNIAAVAAMFIIAIGTLYFLNTPKQEAIQYTEDIQPGSKKATLILDDGSSIEISSQPLSISQSGSEIRNDSLKGLSLNANEKTQIEQAVKYSTLVIPQGGEYRITLQDGTQIWLNSGSELRFPSYFAGTRREVELKGEAYFKVTHDTRKPFYVKTQGTEVKVYGTEFNIYAYEDENIIATTLVKGSVSVIPSSGKEILIHPNEQHSYSKSEKITQVKTVDVNLYTSWINGIYSFENATLEDIMNYIHRWYDFKVDYENNNLRKTRFTGEFQKDKPISYGLDLIKLTCEVNFKINGNLITVTK